MEENAIKAIMIGVGLFIILIIISGVFMYVNVARGMANSVVSSLNSWDDIDYTNILDYSGDITIDCRGIDVVNFIRANINNKNIKISIGRNFENEDMSAWKNDIGNVSEERLRIINVSATNIKMTKKTFEDYALITIEGNIFARKEYDNSILYGDIDGNGDVNVDDLTALENYLYVSILTSDGYSNGDINKNGQIDYDDAVYLAQYNMFPDLYPLPIEHGDFNGDGVVNNEDVELLYNYSMWGTSDNVNLEAADINLDKIVDWKDYEELSYMIDE